MPKLRLGVALLLPAPVAAEVDGLRRALGDGSLGRIPPHVTLVPPVNVRGDDLGRALALLRAAAAATPSPLPLNLGPPATFLPDNPVLYLSVGGDLDRLAALRRRVWEAPLTRSLTWPFVPHVTLADDAAEERIAAAVAALADYRAEAVFDRVHLLVERRPAGRAGAAGPEGSVGPGPEGSVFSVGSGPEGPEGPAGPARPEGRGGPRWVPLADAAFGPPSIVARAGPLAVELTRSRTVDPEARALLFAEGVVDNGEEDDADGVIVTARREGDVVGVGRARLTPDGCQTIVVVATLHRNQGIGRHVDAALEMAVADAGWGCRYPTRPPALRPRL